ncbi:MAG: glycosyltransferase family 39 protein [Planctomycetota bacterium]|jgi:4-amino-4-deoxy-L-arabinose transferase-like glycosyltransferase|nr:glycosyltransferase family 39 protein [Planctomycetota bacterium]
MFETLSERQKRVGMAVAIFLLTFLPVLMTITSPGIAWDEVFYLGGGYSYGEWFSRIGIDAFQADVIRHHWQVNHEHPPVAKLIVRISMSLFGTPDNFVLPARIGMAFTFGVLVMMTFVFMSHYFTVRVGLFTALSLLLMPRMFGHAHFSELDMPMALAWFTGSVAFVIAAEKGRWWLLASAAGFGLALLTKINAFAMPIILCPWAIYHFRKKSIGVCLSLIGGIALFFIGWPWLWIDPIGHLCGYLGTLGAKRTVIPVYFFGEVYGEGNRPPMFYPLIMALGTVPLGTALAALWGGWHSGRAVRNALPVETFLLVNAGFIILSACSPNVPKYDGTRLFLPAFPFIACLAGLGLDRGFKWLREKLGSEQKAIAVAGLYLTIQIGGLVWIHPHYLCYYGGMLGGTAGAHKLGMETNYWNEVFDDEALMYVTKNTPRNGTYCVFPYGHFASEQLLDPLVKNLRPDIRRVPFDPADWDLLVLICRQGMFTEKAWQIYRHQEPAFVNSRQGVPLCMIFEKDTTGN